MVAFLLNQTKTKWKSFKNNIKLISLICNQHFKIKLIQWIILWLNLQLIKEKKLRKFKRQLLKNLLTSVLTKTIKLESILVWLCNQVLWKLLNLQLILILIRTWKWWIKRKPIFLIIKSKVWTSSVLMNSSNYFYFSKGMEGTKVVNLITLNKITQTDYNILSLRRILTT